jgi:hypothetical protein
MSAYQREQRMVAEIDRTPVGPAEEPSRPSSPVVHLIASGTLTGRTRGILTALFLIA